MNVHIPFLDRVVARWWSKWVRRGRTAAAQPLPEEPGWSLRYTLRYRLTITALFLGFSALYGWAFLWARDLLAEEPLWQRIGIVVGSCLIWLLLAGLQVATLIERVSVTEDGVARRSWRGSQRLRWAVIDWFRLEPSDDTLTLGQSEGAQVRISLFLDGLSSLERPLVECFGLGIREILDSHFPNPSR